MYIADATKSRSICIPMNISPIPLKSLGINVGECFARPEYHIFLLNDLDFSGHACIWGVKLLGIRVGEYFAPRTDNLFLLHDLDISGMI